MAFFKDRKGTVQLPIIHMNLESMIYKSDDSKKLAWRFKGGKTGDIALYRNAHMCQREHRLVGDRVLAECQALAVGIALHNPSESVGLTVPGVLVEVAAMRVPNEVVTRVTDSVEGNFRQVFLEIVTKAVCVETAAIVQHHNDLSEDERTTRKARKPLTFLRFLSIHLTSDLANHWLGLDRRLGVGEDDLSVPIGWRDDGWEALGNRTGSF